MLQFAGCAFPLLAADAPRQVSTPSDTLPARTPIDPDSAPGHVPTPSDAPPARSLSDPDGGLRVTALDEPYDIVTIARSDGALHFHIATKKLCRTDLPHVQRANDSFDRAELRPLEIESQRVPCEGLARPAGGVDIGLQAGPRLFVLGTTSQTGDFTLALGQLDALFADSRVEPQAIAQVLVHGEKAAELPLGEIAHRGQLIDATIAAVDRALVPDNIARERLETLLAEIMSLKQQGADDPRLLDAAHGLRARLRETAGASRYSGDWGSDAADFDLVFRALPTMCKITVRGGAVVLGTLLPEGLALAVLLGVVSATVGDDLTQWLTYRCCEMAASSLLNAELTDCPAEGR